MNGAQVSARNCIIVEGEIGAGKTELCKVLAAELRARGLTVCLVLEPVDQWEAVGILKQFYADRARFGYGFQTYVFATRTLAIADAVAACPNADVYLLERSPATDRVFFQLQRDLVAPVEIAMYETWARAYERILPFDLSKATVLYLKTSIDVCMDRHRARDRDGEVATGTDGKKSGGLPREYQVMLRRAHEAYLQGKHPGEFPQMPASPFPLESVVELGPDVADLNFRDPSPDRDRVVAEILDRVQRREIRVSA